MFQEYFNSQKSKINENNFLLLEMNIERLIISFIIEEQFINKTSVGVLIRFQEFFKNYKINESVIHILLEMKDSNIYRFILNFKIASCLLYR